ncbi:hypothetical protein ABHF91_04260 [Pseudaeromonas sp. ZJS20]|uniref:hypothetical protein n=1 Tax=Pseudaeromonas aegiceratis TaxID=3153928 RepID=UPI00390C81DC
MLRTCAVLLLTLLGLPLPAKQLAFYSQGDVLHYQWQTPDGQVLRLQSKLNPQTQVPALIDWRPAMADAYVYRALMHDAAVQYPDQRFELHQQNGRWQMSYRVADADLGAEISQWLGQQRSQRWGEYLAQHYFVQDQDPFGRSVVRYDYARLVQTLAPELATLATQLQAVTEQAKPQQTPPNAEDLRRLIGWMLDFVQSIPYRALGGEGGSRGLSFLLPRQVLAQNVGDCDSKMVLMAALLRSRFPKLPLKLVLVPNHALLAVGMAAQGEDKQLPANGGVLLEVAGPGLFPPGRLAKTTQMYLDSGHFQAIEVAP